MADGHPNRAQLTNGKAPSVPTRIGALILAILLIIAALNNEAVKLPSEIGAELPAPGIALARAVVGLVGAILLLWGLDAFVNFQIGRALETVVGQLPWSASRKASPLIPLPKESRMVRGQHENPEWVDASCKWRLTEAARNLEIVHVELEDPSNEQPIPGDFETGNGYVTARFSFHADYPKIDHIDEVRRTAILIDSNNRRLRSEVTFTSEP